MPAMRFVVRWPDGAEEACYSPSTVITQYLYAGSTYAMADFIDQCEAGLLKASDRVKEVYGYHCSSAMDQLASLKRRAGEFSGEHSNSVTVVSIAPA